MERKYKIVEQNFNPGLANIGLWEPGPDIQHSLVEYR